MLLGCSRAIYASQWVQIDVLWLCCASHSVPFLCICRYLWLREPDEVSDSYNSYCYINCQLVGPYLLACNIFSLKAIHMVAIQHDIVPLFCLVWEQGEM